MARKFSFAQLAAHASGIKHLASAQGEEHVTLLYGPPRDGLPAAVAPSPLEFPHPGRALEVFRIDTPKRLEIELWARAGEVRRAVECLAGLPALEKVAETELNAAIERLGHTPGREQRLDEAQRERPDLFQSAHSRIVQASHEQADAIIANVRIRIPTSEDEDT